MSLCGRVVGKLDSTDRYKHGNIECIDAIKAALSPEEFKGFCKGNVIKYVWREKFKGQNDDLAKASTYLEYLTETEKVCKAFRNS